MEYALPELLSRDDILRILNDRHLQVNNMNQLTHEELLRVYKRFVMPFSQRPERSKRIKNSFVPIDKFDDYEKEMQVESLKETDSMDVDIPYPYITVYNGDNSRCKGMTSPVGEKRRQRSFEADEDFNAVENDYQYQLSSVTKRIRINTLS